MKRPFTIIISIFFLICPPVFFFRAAADVVIAPGLALRRDISGRDSEYLRDIIHQLDRYARAAGIDHSKEKITIVTGGERRTGLSRKIFYIPGDSETWHDDFEVRSKLYTFLISHRFNLPYPGAEVKLFAWIVCGIDAELEAAATSGEHLNSNREYFLLSNFVTVAGKLPDFAVMSRTGYSTDPVLQKFMGAQARILLQILAANGKIGELCRQNFAGAAPDCFLGFYTSKAVADEELNAAAINFIWNRNRPIPAAALSRVSAMEKMMVQKADENGELTGDFEELDWRALSIQFSTKRLDKQTLRDRFARQFSAFSRLCPDREKTACTLVAAAARQLDCTPENDAAFLQALNALKAEILRRQAIERFLCDTMLVNTPLPDHFALLLQSARVENYSCSEGQMRFLLQILNNYLPR